MSNQQLLKSLPICQANVFKKFPLKQEMGYIRCFTFSLRYIPSLSKCYELYVAYFRESGGTFSIGKKSIKFQILGHFVNHKFVELKS